MPCHRTRLSRCWKCWGRKKNRAGAAAGTGAVDAAAKPPRTPVSPKAFYGRGMTRAEQILLEEALTVEGLDQEIGLLRLRLKEANDEHPEDLRLLTHGIQALVRAVAAQYRLSPKARRDLADNLSAVLNSLGDQLLPADR